MEDIKIEQWVKIGETTKEAPTHKLGKYARYAIMEYIEKNGDRKYKEVLICTWSDMVIIKTQ